MLTSVGKRALLGALALMLAACVVACSRTSEERGASKRETVQTPIGEFDARVKNKADAAQIGLPIYPGARAETAPNQSSSAETRLQTPFVNIRIAALKFASDDPPEKLQGFYRDALSKYGKVDEDNHVTGKIDMGQFSWVSSRKDVTLNAGNSDDQRLVIVQPAEKGSRFMLMRVRVGEANKTL